MDAEVSLKLYVSSSKKVPSFSCFAIMFGDNDKYRCLIKSPSNLEFWTQLDSGSPISEDKIEKNRSLKKTDLKVNQQESKVKLLVAKSVDLVFDNFTH
ncbi:hypothetical protein ACTXT7_014500 [Hymenolepis weldensis]